MQAWESLWSPASTWKKLGMTVCAYHPNVRKAGTERYLGHAGQAAQPNWWALTSVKGTASEKKRQKTTKKDSNIYYLCSPQYIWTSTYVYALMNKHQKKATIQSKQNKTELQRGILPLGWGRGFRGNGGVMHYPHFSIPTWEGTTNADQKYQYPLRYY